MTTRMTTFTPKTSVMRWSATLPALGSDSLQHNVQCLDLVNGCLTALYHLRLIQNTGTTGDLLLFSPRPGPAVDFYHDWFWRQEQAHPPDVVVLGNEWYFDYLVSGNKLDAWPRYAAYLRSNYVPVISRSFGTLGQPAVVPTLSTQGQCCAGMGTASPFALRFLPPSKEALPRTCPDSAEVDGPETLRYPAR